MLLVVSKLIFPLDIGEKVIISEDLEITRLSEHGYIHISYMTVPKWGRVACNGLIYKMGNECFVVDTPPDQALSQQLIDWIEKNLKADIKGIAVGHWHDDCLGGLDAFHAKKIPSYSLFLTQTEAKKHGFPVPKTGFHKELKLQIGDSDVICYYPGGGHTRDNIVVWFPADKLLFGGCLVKEKRSQSKGNTKDAVLEDWAQSVLNVKKRFPEAQIVIPGHGQPGGLDLLDHTARIVAVKNDSK
jgi:metallo-beta-lactamase class B